MTSPEDRSAPAALPAPVRWIALGAALLAGVVLRLQGLADQALFGDEMHTLRACTQGVGTILTSFDHVGSHVVLPLLQHLSLELFGDGLLAFRLPAVVPGILTLLLLYPLGSRLVGPTPALLGTWALALSPMHVYYARFARSYALSTLLVLVLVWLLARLLERGDGASAAPGRRRLGWVGVALLAGLLPVVHLSSGGSVAALGIASLAIAWRRGGGPRGAVAPLLAFACAALLALLAFAPVLAQVREYLVEAVPREHRDRPSTWFGIAVLLAGGPLVAGGALVVLPVGLVLLARERATVASLVLATVLGPLVALAATRPHGMEFAWARYLLGALPVLCLVPGWLLVRGLRLGEGVGLAVGLALVLGAYLTGPLRGTRPRTATFDNSYLAMRSLPPFDEPWVERPSWYDVLRDDPELGRVVEFPPMFTRSTLLYRNHALHHDKQVLLGWTGALPAPLVGGPYVDLDTVSAADADVIVLHRDPRREVARYWSFVYGAGGGARGGVDAGFLERHRTSFVNTQPGTDPALMAQVAALLRNRLGPADHKDDDLLVWRLAP